jgi:hypothetical protein
MRPKMTSMSCVLVFALSLLAQNAAAKVPEDQAKQLNGDKYTCNGAERAGSAAGVAAFTGKWLDSWPGMVNAHGYDPGPYAAEKPLYVISADNADKYADKLSEGQKALLRKYPKSFRMPVYASHRDFRLPDWACEVVRKNATASEVVHDGLGATGTTGAIPFPFPQNGSEAIWNIILPYRPWNEQCVDDIADVYNGKIAWGKQRFRTFSLFDNPKVRGSMQDPVNSYFYNESILPPRDKGSIGVGYQLNDFTKGQMQVWQYIPGIRRMREAPEVCCDFPVPPAGLRTIDDDYGFNGSPRRYTWKLVGKKEMYIPYNTFRINDPSVKYSQLIGPETINPNYMRYELHRVWVVEGNLRDGYRHIYKKRVLFADEDTWLIPWAENYDGRGQLWRIAFINFRYAPDAQAYHRGASIYHDLTANAYEAGYLVNEAGADWWKLNDPDMNPKMFSAKGAAMGGH